MRKKQLAILGEERRCRYIDFNNDAACAEAIKRHDDNDINMKKIQKAYHIRFMKILPASKVFKIIRAEDDFHRQMFKRASRRDKKR